MDISKFRSQLVHLPLTTLLLGIRRAHVKANTVTIKEELKKATNLKGTPLEITASLIALKDELEPLCLKIEVGGGPPSTNGSSPPAPDEDDRIDQTKSVRVDKYLADLGGNLCGG